MAWSTPSFFGACAVLVSPHNGAIDHRIFVVGIDREMLENTRPHACFCPPAESPMDIDGIAKAFRQITPGNARPVAVQHGFDE
jgi:hypothetical protein